MFQVATHRNPSYLFAMKNVPNLLSFLRIVLAPIFIFMYLHDEIVYRSLSIAVFAIAAMTDYFDGYIARTFNAGSKLGNFLDPLADKILTFAGFIVLPILAPEIFPLLPIALIIFRDIAVTGLRVYAEQKNVSIETRSSAKFKTMVQMIYLYIALLAGLFMHVDVFPGEFIRQIFALGIFTWALVIVSAITVYTGIEYVYINRHLFVKSDIQKA